MSRSYNVYLAVKLANVTTCWGFFALIHTLFAMVFYAVFMDLTCIHDGSCFDINATNPITNEEMVAPSVGGYLLFHVLLIIPCAIVCAAGLQDSNKALQGCVALFVWPIFITYTVWICWDAEIMIDEVTNPSYESKWYPGQTNVTRLGLNPSAQVREEDMRGIIGVRALLKILVVFFIYCGMTIVFCGSGWELGEPKAPTYSYKEAPQSQMASRGGAQHHHSHHAADPGTATRAAGTATRSAGPVVAQPGATGGNAGGTEEEQLVV